MKISKRKLKQLIEAFIAGTEGTVNTDTLKGDLQQDYDLKVGMEKIINKALNNIDPFRSKIEPLLRHDDISIVHSGMAMAHSFGAISDTDWKQWFELMKYAKSPKRNKPAYNPYAPGIKTSRAYAAHKMSRDDPNFEENLRGRVWEYISDNPDFVSDYTGYDTGAPTDDILDDMSTTIAEELAQKYKIYDSNWLGGNNAIALTRDTGSRPQDIDDIIADELQQMGIDEEIANYFSNIDEEWYP